MKMFEVEEYTDDSEDKGRYIYVYIYIYIYTFQWITRTAVL